MAQDDASQKTGSDSGDGLHRPNLPDNSSPEAIEFTRIIERLGELLRGGPKIDWPESRKRCAEILEELALGCEKSAALGKRLDGASFIKGGDEHLLARHSADGETPRVYKLTYGENFGCFSRFFPKDPELTGRHFFAEGNADPFFYLGRWVYLNSITHYQTRYEGILPPLQGGVLPLICVSQPELPKENPSPWEIERALARFGYLRISHETFIEKNSGILLTDVAPRNVRIVDGIPALFDVLAQKASDQIRRWAFPV